MTRWPREEPHALVAELLDEIEALRRTAGKPGKARAMNDQRDGFGLIAKYVVLKVFGEGDPDASYTIAEGTFPAWRKRSRCFVLSPDKRDAYGEASRAALSSYALSIATHNPKLAADLREWLKRECDAIEIEQERERERKAREAARAASPKAEPPTPKPPRPWEH